MTPRITCTLIEQWISLSLDGELSPERTQLLEEHLDGCADCRNSHARTLETERLLVGELQNLSGAMDDLLDERISSTTIERLELEQNDQVVRASWSWAVTPTKVAAAGLGFVLTAIVWISLGTASLQSYPCQAAVASPLA